MRLRISPLFAPLSSTPSATWKLGRWPLPLLKADVDREALGLLDEPTLDQDGVVAALEIAKPVLDKRMAPSLLKGATAAASTTGVSSAKAIGSQARVSIFGEVVDLGRLPSGRQRQRHEQGTITVHLPSSTGAPNPGAAPRGPA